MDKFSLFKALFKKYKARLVLSLTNSVTVSCSDLEDAKNLQKRLTDLKFVVALEVINPTEFHLTISTVNSMRADYERQTEENY